MKKIKKIAYIVLVAIIIILSLTLYTNASKDNSKIQKEKTYTEIKYLQSKIINLLNSINNIQSRNYDVSVTQVTESSNESSSSGGSSDSSSNSKQGQSGENGQSSNNQDSSKSSSEKNSEQKEEKFELKQKGVLTSLEDINRDNIKNEIEILYDSIPTITLDLYQLDINKEDILNFNKEFDNLTMVIKEEKKEETLDQLSKLYGYIPKFIEKAIDDELDKIVAETRFNILKAYSKLDSEDWNQISQDLNEAINSFSKLLTNTNIDEGKQYYINKGYVMINELQNAVNIKDKSIFLIKYKNLIEEFNNL